MLVPLVATLVILSAEPEPSPRRVVASTGLVTFGLAWMLSATLATLEETNVMNLPAVGSTPAPSLRALMAPVIGPALAALEERNQQPVLMAALFAMSALQLGALSATLVGLLLPEREDSTRLRITPLGASGPGVSVDFSW